MYILSIESALAHEAEGRTKSRPCSAVQARANSPVRRPSCKQRPQTGKSRPNSSWSCSTDVGQGRPSVGQNRQDIGQGRPNSSLSCRTNTSQSRPSVGQNKLETEHSRPNSSWSSNTGQSRLSFGQNRPATGHGLSRRNSCNSRTKLKSAGQTRPKTAFAKLSQPQDHGQATQQDPSKSLEGDSVGLTGSSVRYVGTQPKTTWNMADSQSREPSYGSGLQGNTPRILELDINRMMIGQNTISATIPGLSNDRLVNASNSNLRSYMTVNRPTGPASTGKSERPTSGSRGMDSPGPPPSPTNRSSSTTKRVRMSTDIEVPTVMSNSQPLPPIGSTPSPTPGRTHSGGRGRQSPTRIPIGEVSPSPPGSRGSFRQSPVGMSDTDMSPIK